AAATGPAPAAVAALTEGVAVNALWNKSLPAALVLVGVAVLGIGIGSLSLPAAHPTPNKMTPALTGRDEKPPAPPANKAEPLTVKGRVLDLQGKPIRGAVLTVHSVGT